MKHVTTIYSISLEISVSPFDVTMITIISDDKVNDASIFFTKIINSYTCPEFETREPTIQPGKRRLWSVF